MADEILGNCYELITEIAIQDYSAVLKKGEQVFTQETPIGIGIVPDIIIGKDIQNPRILLQVHHTRAEKSSELKFWRNIGEYVDARNSLGGLARIVTITFDSLQKRKLSAAANHLMDGFLEIDRQSYGKEILDFAKALETEFKNGKTKESERLALARKRLKARSTTIMAIKALAAQLNATLSTASKVGVSWFATYSAIQETRVPPRVPARKLTTLRRALGRFLPVADEVLLRRLLISVRTDGQAPWPQYFVDVGIVTKSVAGTRFTNPCPPGSRVSRKMESEPAYEVYRLTELFDDDTIVKLWNNLRSATASLSQACASIRSVNDFALYHKFVVKNFTKLSTPAGMAQALIDCFNDPDLLFGQTIGLANSSEKGLWLFDYVMTVIKAQTGKSQGYGYNKLGEDSGIKVDDKRSILDFALPKMLNRSEFPPIAITKAFSSVLATKLESVTKRWIVLNQTEISRFFLKVQFEDKIYKTPSFSPISAEFSRHMDGRDFSRISRLATFLTGPAGGGAATCDVIMVNDNVIISRSVSAQGDDHKTKELCGRIGMLRVTTDENGKVIPTSFKKAILVVDGTWKQDQLDRLATAGFDAIYYVDEIDQLVKDLSDEPSVNL
jgi:hypothetical protein